MKFQNAQQATPEQIQELARSISESTPKESIDVDLDNLILSGKVERELEVLGAKVTMHTLSQKEKEKSLHNATVDILQKLDQFESVKIKTLVQAISKFGNKHFVSDESKKVLFELLENAPAILVDVLYGEYQKLVDDQNKLLDNVVKKNPQ